MGDFGAVGPLVGREVGHLFQSLAMLEDVGDGPDCHSGFVDAAAAAAAQAAVLAAAQAAIAAVRAHIHSSVPSPQPGVWGAEPGLQGKEGLETLCGRLRYSGNMIQEDIQVPLDSVVQDNDGVGNEAGQTLQRSALEDNLGWGMDLERVSEASGQHSKMGWMGGSYLRNSDPGLHCRHRGHLDTLLALPAGCTLAVSPFLRDRYLHNVAWNGSGDTSSLRGSQDTEKRPCLLFQFAVLFFS